MNIRNCTVKFKDEEREYNFNIAIGQGIYTRDDRVFYVCENEQDFERLFSQDNGEDFYIMRDNSSYIIPFMELTQDDIDSIGGKTMLPSQLRKIANRMSDIYMESFGETLRDAMLDEKINTAD